MRTPRHDILGQFHSSPEFFKCEGKSRKNEEYYDEHSRASACLEVFFSFDSFGYQLGSIVAAVSAQWHLEHVKDALQNIMTEQMPP